LFAGAFAYANPKMKNKIVASGSVSRKSTPFKDLTNSLSEPNHAGI
jgi:hypothetical protein